MVFTKSNEKQPALPTEPSALPFQVPPVAWHASSRSATPFSLQSASSAPRSAMAPHMWTGITARVRGVTAARADDGESVSVSSTSASTGVAPTESTASKLATKVKVGMTTSSPEPTPRAASAVVSAAVPLETSWACAAPVRAARAASSSRAFQRPRRGPSNP
jgi:hypothetical protein